MDYDFDFIIIGGGSAGYAAARTAGGLGLKTAVIDGGESVGGLCILRGCMPSKTLIESANRFLTLRRANEFGLKADAIGVDASRIVERKRGLIGGFAKYREGQLQSGNFEFIRAGARFVGPHTLEIAFFDGTVREVTAAAFLIATGSTVSELAIPGLADAGYLTSDDVLDLEKLPESIAILGGGAIAVEMAHYFSGLGVRVTIVQRSPRVLKELDDDVTGSLVGAFRKRGIEVITGTTLLRVEPAGMSKRVVFEQDGRETAVEAAEILEALGRHPNTRGLGLEAAGAGIDGRRVTTTLTQQTPAPHIFAAGDVCGPHEIVHIAIQQGEIAARNAARILGGTGEALEKIDYRLKLFVVFSEPQIAVVGITNREADAAGRRVLAASYPFDDHGKSLVMGETEGFVKLIADPASGEIVGGAVIGPHASDLIHEITVAMHFRATVHDLAAIPHYHPTLSEIWTYPAEELAGLVAL